MKAIELNGTHLGKTIRSRTYWTKGKLARARNNDFPHDYELVSIYMHKNGTILLNGSTDYVKADTEVIVLD